jgi:tetratricopeptide (TPR) repeat protein
LQARALAAESLALYREIGNEQGTAGALLFLAWLTEDAATARALREEGLAIRQKHEDDKHALAEVLGHLGRHDESLALYRELGDRSGIAAAQVALVGGAIERGDLAGAIGLYQASLTLYRELDDERGIAFVLQELAEALRLQGEEERASACLEESVARFRRLGDAMGLVWALWKQGQLAVSRSESQSEREKARSVLAESLSLFRGSAERSGDRFGVALCLGDFAVLAAAEDQEERAARLFGVAEALH